jgi:hypothetical protein
MQGHRALRRANPVAPTVQPPNNTLYKNHHIPMVLGFLPYLENASYLFSLQKLQAQGSIL